MSDSDTGYNRLDNFFKSVSALMSNQLWYLMEASISDFEKFFDQFKSGTSDTSLFVVKMAVANGQIKFDPPLGDLDSMILNIYEEAVAIGKDIPRVETKLFTSLLEEHLVLPSMNLDDDRVSEGNYTRAIISQNLLSPQKHLASYERFKFLLTPKAEKRIEDFLKEKHDLDDYESVSYSIIYDLKGNVLMFFIGNPTTPETCRGDQCKPLNCPLKSYLLGMR